MVRLFKVYAAFILILLSSAHTGQLYSQDNFTDSIITGKSYRFVMYDDAEVSGKVLSSGKEFIKLLSVSGDVLMIVKNNILFYSPFVKNSIIKYSVSLLGGISLLSTYDYYDETTAGVNIDIAGIYYINETKAVKLDIGYTYIKAKQDEYYPAPLIYPYYPTTYEGGDISFYTVKLNGLLGMFKPLKRIMAYGSAGLGFQLSRQNKIDERYYNYVDSAYRNTAIPAENDFNLVLSLGAGLMIKISNRINLHAEAEFNYITIENDYRFFYGSRSYFPVRLGVMYSIF